MQRIALTFYSLLLATSALAQQAAPGAERLADDEPEIRRYTVELIVFRYVEDVSVGTEVFLPEMIEPVVPDPVAEVAVSDREAAELRTLQHRFEMQVLDESRLSLTGTYDRLDRLDAYKPLMHVAWTQTVLPEQATPALDLRRLGAVPAALNGSFTLYLSRFLHLVVDLELDAPKTAQIYGRAAPGLDEPIRRRGGTSEARSDDAGYPSDKPQYEPLRFRIDEDRLFKNGETRYFDHPKFGVIAKVVRYEQPEVEEQPDDTAFLSPAGIND